jgi:hypothetical protein
VAGHGGPGVETYDQRHAPKSAATPGGKRPGRPLEAPHWTRPREADRHHIEQRGRRRWMGDLRSEGWRPGREGGGGGRGDGPPRLDDRGLAYSSLACPQMRAAEGAGAAEEGRAAPAPPRTPAGTPPSWGRTETRAPAQPTERGGRGAPSSQRGSRRQRRPTARPRRGSKALPRGFGLCRGQCPTGGRAAD